MTNPANSIGSNYNKNIYTINQGPKQIVKKPVNSDKAKHISEIPTYPNDVGIRTPISYVKIDEKEFPYGLKAHFYKLSNGQKIVILPKEGPTVLRSYVNTGSLNEPDNIRGISHYIEHNLFNGSEGLEAGEFFQKTDKMGAETNASTGLAETNYFISSNLLNDDDLENKMKLQASMLETPRFAVDMLEKEKGIVNSEINMITSDPENIAMNNTLKNLFNIKTKSQDVIAGTTDNITNLTREDVVNYFNNNYYPANIVTVVSGEVDPDETIRLVSKYFNSTKCPPTSRHFEKLEPISKTIRQDIISDKTKSANIVIGFVGPQNNNAKDSIYVSALSQLMFESSKSKKKFKMLNSDVGFLQEKVLAKTDFPSAIMLLGNSSDENSEKLLKQIYKQVEIQQNNLVSQEDLDIVKRNLKKDFVNIFESSFEINDFIGTSILEDKLQFINKYEKIIDEMTPQDLQDAARKYFDLNKAAITVLHPNTTNETKINNNYNEAKNINFTGSVKKHAINAENVKQYDLPNNYRLSLYNSSLPDVHTNLIYRVEDPVETKNPAVFAVLNKIFNNGTAHMSYEEFDREVEKNGTPMAIKTGKYGLVGTYHSDIKDYDKAHALFKELLENPRFTQETFDKSVSDLKDNLLRAEKTPWNKLLPLLFPSKVTREEMLKGLENVTLDEVKQAYFKLLQNSHAICSVAAPFSDSRVKNKVFTNLNQLQNTNPYKNILREDYSPVKKSLVLSDVDNKSQANIVMAYKYRCTGNIKDEATLELLNIILGSGPSSRLFNDLREKQKLAYYVRSNISKENTTGVMSLSIGTTTDNSLTGEKSYDNLQKSINGFKYHVDKIKTEKVTEDELDKAKLALKNSILSNNEKTSDKNSSILIGTSNWYGPLYHNQLLDVIDTITVDDIYNAAQHVFSGKPLYSVVATQNTLDYNKDYLDKLIG